MINDNFMWQVVLEVARINFEFTVSAVCVGFSVNV